MKRLKPDRLSRFAYGEVFPTPQQAAAYARAALEEKQKSHAKILAALRMALQFVITTHGGINDGDIQKQLEEAIIEVQGL